MFLFDHSKQCDLCADDIGLVQCSVISLLFFVYKIGLFGGGVKQLKKVLHISDISNHEFTVVICIFLT